MYRLQFSFLPNFVFKFEKSVGNLKNLISKCCNWTRAIILPQNYMVKNHRSEAKVDFFNLCSNGGCTARAPAAGLPN